MFKRTLILAGLIGATSGETFAATIASSDSSAALAQLNAGYNRTAGQENDAVDPSTRDADGNRVIVNGVITNMAPVYQRSLAEGVGFSSSGASSGATAIGNSLNVVVSGNNNIVTVNSNQTNTGAVTATAGGGTATATSQATPSVNGAVLNGQLNLGSF